MTTFVLAGRRVAWRWARRPRQPPKNLEQLRDALLGDATPRPGQTDATKPVTASQLTQLWTCNPETMVRLEEMYLTYQGYLRAEDQPQAKERILGPIRAALDLLPDGRPASPDSDAVILRILAEGEPLASDYVTSRAESRSRRSYARGLVGGVVVGLALIVAVGLLAVAVVGIAGVLSAGSWGHFDGAGLRALRDILACTAGGVTGAALSVMLRLNHIERLDYHTVDWRTAVYRLVIGWLFATALLLLIKSGVLTAFTDPSARPADSASSLAGGASLFWWGAVGLLAGFNERWARNLLTRGPTDSQRPKTSMETRQQLEQPGESAEGADNPK